DAASQEAAPELDASSPLDELSDVDLPWPENEELPQIAPLEPEEDIQFADFEEVVPQVELGDEDRISDELVLVFPRERALFPYHALVCRSVGELTPGEDNTEQRPTVRFDIIPGTQYRFGAIDLGNLAAAGADYAMLRDTFEIQTGDPLLADKIVEERYDLDLAI